ncbi:amine oxidase [Bacillus sp. MUM 116]|uniref:flavin monoamine oxidase family protein n=1 Tax=Bacillus sp. MUM 116 TaxID=1678002 RepID=UPI0008F5C647|nr:flavin monoamine oxidase family protein [Bacillus sp. MUM 116]OIK09947.1 amine oxidase [Bacillus sp. MUM 116]
MPENIPALSSEQMISMIKNGLQKSQVPKKITIVGAGIAGLVAASLLKEAGHNVTILEANNIVGGRIYTIRPPFSNGLYLNAGPMRIPDNHLLTLAYIQKLGLSLNPFINRTTTDILYINGIKTRLNLYEQNPEIFNFPVQPNERGKSAEELFNLAVEPIINFINKNPKKNWRLIENEFKNYSLGSFLNSYHYQYGTTFSEGAIDMIDVLLDYEAYMGMSFLEVMREASQFRTNRFFEITGGMDLLPKAFLPQLKDDIRYYQRMTKIIQDNNRVTIHFRDERTSNTSTITSDLAIITIPFSVLRFVKIEPFHSFSYYKRRAIREINYMAATKVGIEFKSRFWEKYGQYGGKSITDLPIRFTYYPSQGIGTNGPAVVLASYTWADEAMTWNGLTDEDRIFYSLKNLAEIFGDQVYSEFVSGTSFSWVNNPYATGAVVAFDPGQENELFPYIKLPEGRVHFAGEHTTLTHGWMQGAIESGIRVANEVNHLPKY